MTHLDARVPRRSTAREAPIDAETIRAALASVADPSRAPAMQAYMKSAMPYLGVTAPALRKAMRSVLANVRFEHRAAWERTVRAIWDGAEHREERYAALAIAGHRSARAFQTPEAMPLYEHLVVTGAWWDLVDEIATHRVGDILRAHPAAMKPLLTRWAHDPDLWKRRTAILAQCRDRDADFSMLRACIEPSIGDRDFFARKAIGWALREHAKRHAAEVIAYVTGQKDRLAPLSIREALKHHPDARAAALAARER